MLTAKKKKNITYRTVVILTVNIVKDLLYSVMNKPDIKMTAKARTSLNINAPRAERKLERVPTNVLDREDVFLVSRFEIQKTFITQKQCNRIISWPSQVRSNCPVICS